MRKSRLLIAILSVLLIGKAVASDLQSYYKSKFMGINTSLNVRLLPDDSSPDMHNFNLEEVGSVKERPVFGYYNSAAQALGDNYVTGLFKFYRKSSKHFVVCGGSKICSASGGTISDITNTAISVTSGSYWSACSFVKTGNTDATLYLFNPSVPMQTWQGTGNTTTPGDFPQTNCAYGVIHKNRCWAARSDAYPFRLYLSEVNNPESWTDYIDLPATTEEITGLISWGGNLYIFTETAIYVIQGNTIADFSMKKTASQVGAIAPRSIRITDVGIMFLSRSGVYAFDGSVSRKMSDNIEPTIKTISSMYIKNSCALYDGRYYWLSFTPSGYSYNNKIYLYDILVKEWIQYAGSLCNINYFERAYGGTDRGEIYGGSSTTNGRIILLQAASGTETVSDSTKTQFDFGVTDNTVTTDTPSVVYREPYRFDTKDKLLAHFDGTAGQTTYTAETGQVMTFVAGAKLDENYKKFGSTSLALTTGAGDCVSVPDSPDWNFGTDDLTIDYWIRFDSFPGGSPFTLGQYELATFYWYILTSQTSCALQVRIGATFPVQVAFDYNFTPGCWYHIAWVRKSGDWKVFVNGEEKPTTIEVNGSFGDRIADLYIGGNPVHGTFIDGWIDELRITPGLARWDKNFFTVHNGKFADQPTQINAAGTTTLDRISWIGIYPQDTKISFQTRTGVTADTVYYNAWQYWSSANTVTIDTVTDVSVAFKSSDSAKLTVYKPSECHRRDTDLYEDEDCVSPNCAGFTVYGAVSKGQYAQETIPPVNLTGYDWITFWTQSPETDNTVEITIGESYADLDGLSANGVTPLTVTVNTTIVTSSTAPLINRWHRTDWYIGNIYNKATRMDAINSIRVTYKGTLAGNVLYGDMHAHNYYTSGDIISSTPNDFIQYRCVMSSDNERTPELTSITLTYTPSSGDLEPTMDSYYYTKPLDFKTPQLNKQYDSLSLEFNSTTNSTVAARTIYCDYDIDSGTKTGTLSFPITSTASTVRMIKNFPSSTFGKTMQLKIYNNDRDAQITVRACEIRYRPEGIQPN